MVRYGSILVTGEGSISAEAIRWVIEIEDIDDRALVTYKLVVYLRTALETRNKEIGEAIEKEKQIQR